ETDRSQSWVEPARAKAGRVQKLHHVSPHHDSKSVHKASAPQRRREPIVLRVAGSGVFTFRFIGLTHSIGGKDCCTDTRQNRRQLLVSLGAARKMNVLSSVGRPNERAGNKRSP